MKLLEYREAVKRTCPVLPPFIGAKATNMGILDSIHMVLGMFSEIYELNEAFTKGDKVNIREELIDILWYACNYANKHNIIFDGTVLVLTPNNYEGWTEAAIFEAAEQAQGSLINALSELANYDKKELAYEKAETPEIRERRDACIQIVVIAVFRIGFLHKQNMEEGMQQNINKLLARFPIDEGFSTERANTRDLEQERKQLEN